MKRLFVLAGLLSSLSTAGLLTLSGTPAAAHPLGNFSVNQYAGITLSPTSARLDYVLDQAELPAYQTRSKEIDRNHDGRIDDRERDRHAAAACARAAVKNTLTVAGYGVTLHSEQARLTFPAGAAGLPTLRLECRLAATTAITGDTKISFGYGEYLDRVGWREIVVATDRVTLLRSNAPTSSTSNRLTSYPTSAMVGALDDRSVEMVVRPGIATAGLHLAGTTASGGGAGVDRLTAAFTGLVAHRRLTIGFAAGALLIALVLGGAHALAPGHGKMMMAAYLVNERGSLRQALSVAGTVALTHTVGVLVLGIVLATGLHFAPQRIYTMLTVASGVLVAAVGLNLLRRAWHNRRQQRAHQHGTAHSHDGHSHAGHSHDSDGHGHDGHGHDPHGHGPHGHSHSHGHRAPGAVKGRGIIAMGLAGGLTPSPSAVVVLLGAVALGRAWYGVLLVTAYGIGMAATLTGVGYALTHLRERLERRPRRWMSHTGWRMVPLLTSSVIVVVGLGVATTALLGS